MSEETPTKFPPAQVEFGGQSRPCPQCDAVPATDHATQQMYVVRAGGRVVGYFPRLTDARWAEEAYDGEIEKERPMVTVR